MSARLNLAPEVYQAGQRAKRKKQIATTVGIGVAAISVGIVITGLVILGGQKAVIAKYNGDIKDLQAEVKTYSDLPKAATAAEHLASLENLNQNKVYLTRFFNVLQSSTPQGIGLNSITLNASNEIEMSASARSFALADKFAKALEASNRTVGSNASEANSGFFSDIKLAAVSENGSGSVDFRLTAKVAPEVTNGK